MQIDLKLINDSVIEGLLVNRENLDMLEDILARDEPRIIPDCDTTGFSSEKGKILTQEEGLLMVPGITPLVEEFLGYSAQKDPTWRYRTKEEILWKRYGNLAGKIGVIGLGSCSIIGSAGLTYLALRDGQQPLIFPAITSLMNGALLIYQGSKDIKSSFEESKISIHSVYKTRKRQVRLAEIEEGRLVSEIAHEYAHHLQYEGLGIDTHKTKPTAFIEGHARGAQRHAAREFSIAKRNTNYWDANYFETMGELAATFAWMCDRLKEEDRFTPLYEKNDMVVLAADYIDRKTGATTKHAIGNTFFYLAEKKHGQQIYKDAMQGNLGFMAG